MAMKHLYKIYPQHVLRGVLPKPISEPTILEGLNRQEFIKCFNGGELYAIVGDKEIHITECNYEKAESLFVKKEVLIDPKITFEQPDIDKLSAPMQESGLTKNLIDYINAQIAIEEGNVIESVSYEQDDIASNSNNDSISYAEGKATDAAKDSITKVVSYDSVEDQTAVSANQNAAKAEDIITVTGNSTNESDKDNIKEITGSVDGVSEDNTNGLDDNTAVPTDIVDEKSGNTLQQPQQYSKNHNNQSGQSNYRDQKHGKNNKGKFVINK